MIDILLTVFFQRNNTDLILLQSFFQRAFLKQSLELNFCEDLRKACENNPYPAGDYYFDEYKKNLINAI